MSLRIFSKDQSAQKKEKSPPFFCKSFQQKLFAVHVEETETYPHRRMPRLKTSLLKAALDYYELEARDGSDRRMGEAERCGKERAKKARQKKARKARAKKDEWAKRTVCEIPECGKPRGHEVPTGLFVCRACLSAILRRLEKPKALLIMELEEARKIEQKTVKGKPAAPPEKSPATPITTSAPSAENLAPTQRCSLPSPT